MQTNLALLDNMQAVEFPFTPTGAVNFLHEFGAVAGVAPVGPTLTLPAALGAGSLQAHILQPGFELITHRYTLRASITPPAQTAKALALPIEDLKTATTPPLSEPLLADVISG